MRNFQSIKCGLACVAIIALVNVGAPKVVKAPALIAMEQPKPLTAILPEKELKAIIKEEQPATELPKPYHPLSRGGTLEVLEEYQVTWYNNEGIGYITKSGKRTVDGITVAVDPAVIPLGTWIEVHMPDGTVYKRQAQDTGGAVKGRVIDIYARESTKELLKRGRTYGVRVVILGGE